MARNKLAGGQCIQYVCTNWLLQVHLFDIDVPGKIRFQESETLSSGNQVTVFDTGVRLGRLIESRNKAIEAQCAMVYEQLPTVTSGRNDNAYSR